MIAQKKNLIQLFVVALNAPQWTMTNSNQECSNISAPNSRAYFCSFTTNVGRNLNAPGLKKGYRSSENRKNLIYSALASNHCLSAVILVNFWRERLNNCRGKRLEANNCISPTQEGFRPKKSKIRSLYRLNLLIEKTIRKRKPAELLNIDMEKAICNHSIDMESSTN